MPTVELWSAKGDVAVRDLTASIRALGITVITIDEALPLESCPPGGGDWIILPSVTGSSYSGREGIDTPSVGDWVELPFLREVTEQVKADTWKGSARWTEPRQWPSTTPDDRSYWPRSSYYGREAIETFIRQVQELISTVLA